MQDSEVIIVGAGLSGLSCAIGLQEAGIPFKILESSDGIGGRVRTDLVSGFRLDRGFQVLLTEYAEANRILDFDQLDLKLFEPGALIRLDGKFQRFSDPWRRPQHLIATTFSPVATLMDKMRIGNLRSHVCRGSVEDLSTQPDMSTLQYLQERKFSSRMIERFFKPFFGGVFLENQLETSSRKFEFVFRMFAKGSAAVPAKGMGEICQQLASRLPPNSIRTGSQVTAVEPNRVRLKDGEVVYGSNVVVACEGPTAAKLLNLSAPPKPHGVKCLYFSADKSPLLEPTLVLNGEGHGPINNLCVPSEVASGYAPEGKSLISVTVLEATSDAYSDLQVAVRHQLREWYGEDVDSWEHLRTYSIPGALPQQNPSIVARRESAKRTPVGIIQCGDYLENASIEGALISGREAAKMAAEANCLGV